jgi:fatty acid desaturase
MMCVLCECGVDTVCPFVANAYPVESMKPPRNTQPAPTSSVEWPTLGIAAIAYGGFAFGLFFGTSIGTVFAWLLLTFSIALHSSLQHEILHGHPFRNRLLNEALAFPAIGLLIPFGRFRDTHLAHHHDPNLTDPYDDPESNFVDPELWGQLGKFRQRIARANNTLLGRMALGPALGLAAFYAKDLGQIRQGHRPIFTAYVLHIAGVALVGAIWVLWAGHSLLFWITAAYAGLSLLKIRTFLEHRAHALARGRSVIVEDRGPLAFLFLNNNLHAVHHAHPAVPWYRLWQVYSANRHSFVARNDGYTYPNYATIFRQYFWHPKDPVPHPLMTDGRSLNRVADRESMHAFGPLQANEPAFDPRQQEKTQAHR